MRDGRHKGVVVADGAHGAQLDGLVVHAHGTNGIEMGDAANSSITNSQVFDVGCTGMRATGGEAASLRFCITPSGNDRINQIIKACTGSLTTQR